VENPAVSITRLSDLATTLKQEMVDVLIASPRVRKLPQVLQDLSANPYASGTQAARVRALIAGKAFVNAESDRPAAEEIEPVMAEPPAHTAIPEPEAISSSITTQPATDVTIAAPKNEGNDDVLAEDPEAEAALSTFFKEHEKEIAAQPEKSFQAIGGIYEEIPHPEEPKASAAAASAASSSASVAAAPIPPRAPHKATVRADDGKRDSVLQKISKLDIKGRIQLAMKGTKEERAILVRDGTKIIALAVLDSPKITDGEVEKFAGQKNVLEAVLRAIPMKRRFAKNYAIVRALVFNPRTPLDVSLGLMKNLLVADLKNLSGNKEVAETVRKLALRMFRQKNEATKKN
jgi:hypothetical protein